ncbi:hypothetical protein ACV1DR_08775 [Aeromonas jandaei]
MWFSKVKKYLQELDRAPVLNTLFIISMTSIALIYFFAVINGLNEIIGYENLEKVVDVVSSLATALTLAFLVYQHKVNYSKNYQMTMVEEAKLVIEKIIEQTELLYRWDGKDIFMLNDILNELSNHAIDFNVFYDEINDPALNKIILIRWQDMFLNHYRGISNNIDICSIISENSTGNRSDIELKIIDLKNEAEKHSQGEKYNKYVYEQYCISRAKDLGLYDILSEIECQNAFKYHYFDNKGIKRYLEGVDYNSNPRKSDPSLFAIVEASIIS